METNSEWAAVRNKLGSLEAVSAGRPRFGPPPPDDLKFGLLVVAALLLIGFMYGDWYERRYGPQNLALATAVIRRAGYKPNRVWRSGSPLCGRGSNGYRWESDAALGHVCLGVRDSIVVDQHLR